jgi:hypothetical protein
MTEPSKSGFCAEIAPKRHEAMTMKIKLDTAGTQMRTFYPSK